MYVFRNLSIFSEWFDPRNITNGHLENRSAATVTYFFTRISTLVVPKNLIVLIILVPLIPVVSVNLLWGT